MIYLETSMTFIHSRNLVRVDSLTKLPLIWIESNVLALRNPLIAIYSRVLSLKPIPLRSMCWSVLECLKKLENFFLNSVMTSDELPSSAIEFQLRFRWVKQ